MKKINVPFISNVKEFFSTSGGKMLTIFAIEGIFVQYFTSGTNLANNIYATNLGASDMQIGLVQSIPNLVAVLLMLPVGILNSRAKNARNIPIILACVMGAMYALFGTVPALSESPLFFPLFFLCLGLAGSSLALYNAQWQDLFGEVVVPDQRNRVYAFRNRFMFATGTIVPLLIGQFLNHMPDTESKVIVLRIFYYTCGIMAFIQAYILSRLPVSNRSQSSNTMNFKVIGQTVGELIHSKKFVFFMICMLYFHMPWHMDWSMWYLSQTQYCGFTEVQLSYCTAISLLTQLVCIGFWAKKNQKKSVHFSMIFPGLAFTVAACGMMTSIMSSPPYQVPILLFTAVCGNSCQCAIAICTTQMLLDYSPIKNRAIAISIYTLLITLSNSIFPSVGVALYTALGTTRHGVMIFWTILASMRFSAAVLMFIRYRMYKKGSEWV